MKKRVISALLVIVMLCSTLLVNMPMMKTNALTISMPTTDGKTSGITYTLGQGNDGQVTVNASKFIPEGKTQRPSTNTLSFSNSTYPNGYTFTATESQEQFFLIIHNTGNYGKAPALNHWQWLTGGSDNTAQSYHYVVDDEIIYQLLPEDERAMHAGANTKGTGTDNSNAIGMEICVDEFPATSTSGGEKWGAEADAWYESHNFGKAMCNAAILAATICVRNGFNPYTQVVQHNYVYGKNCPMQMRYVVGSGVGPKDSDNGLNGTYWLIFWNKLIEYYKALGGKYTSTDTAIVGSRGTQYKIYKVGSYKTGTQGAALYSIPYEDGTVPVGTLLGGVPANTSVSVTEILHMKWGKIKYNGITGFVNLETIASGTVPTVPTIPTTPTDPTTPVSPTDKLVSEWNLSAFGQVLSTAYAADPDCVLLKNLSVFTLGYAAWNCVGFSLENGIYKIAAIDTAVTADNQAAMLENMLKAANVNAAMFFRSDSATNTSKASTLKVGLRAVFDNSTLEDASKVAFYEMGTPIPTTPTTASTTPTTTSTTPTTLPTTPTTSVNKALDLVDGSALKLVENSSKLIGVKESVKASDIKLQFATAVIVYDAQNIKLVDGASVGTGCVITATGFITAVVVIKGDIDGDGKVTNTDYQRVKMTFKRSLKPDLAGCYFTAADVDDSGTLNVTDYLAIKRHVQSTYNLFA